MGKARRAKERAKSKAKRSGKKARKSGKGYLKDSLSVVQAKEAAGGKGLVDDRRGPPKGWRPISSGYSLSDNGSSYDGSGNTAYSATQKDFSQSSPTKPTQLGYAADSLAGMVTTPERKMMCTLDGRLVPSNPFFAEMKSTDVSHYVKSLGGKSIMYHDKNDADDVAVIYHPEDFEHEALGYEAAILESPVRGLAATLLLGYQPDRDDPRLVVEEAHSDFIDTADMEPDLVGEQLVATLYREHNLKMDAIVRKLEDNVNTPTPTSVFIYHPNAGEGTLVAPEDMLPSLLGGIPFRVEVDRDDGRVVAYVHKDALSTLEAAGVRTAEASYSPVVSIGPWATDGNRYRQEFERLVADH